MLSDCLLNPFSAFSYNKILSHFNSNLESPNRRTTTKNPPYSADVPIIGFSSTFSRHDNVPLSTFRKIVYHIDVLDLLVSEWTASVRFTTVKADLRLSNASVSRSTDDFDVTSLGEVMNTRGLNDLVLRVYGERASK
jgi:ATP-dependent helicase IRC3